MSAFFHFVDCAHFSSYTHGSSHIGKLFLSLGAIKELSLITACYLMFFFKIHKCHKLINNVFLMLQIGFSYVFHGLFCLCLLLHT